MRSNFIKYFCMFFHSGGQYLAVGDANQNLILVFSLSTKRDSFDLVFECFGDLITFEHQLAI